MKAEITCAAIAYNLRFPGQLFDGQAGLHDNWLREYDPAVARYAQSDPIGPTGLVKILDIPGANGETSVNAPARRPRITAPSTIRHMYISGATADRESARRTSNPYRMTTRRK